MSTRRVHHRRCRWRVQGAAEGESVQLVQQQAVTLVSRTARLPLSEIAVAQTVGGALRTARVIIKERQYHLSCFANQRTVPEVSSTSKEAGRARLLRLSRDLGDGVTGTKRSGGAQCGEVAGEARVGAF